MGDTSGVDGIDLYADVEDFNEDLDASAGNADGSNPGREFDSIVNIFGHVGPYLILLQALSVAVAVLGKQKVTL